MPTLTTIAALFRAHKPLIIVAMALAFTSVSYLMGCAMIEQDIHQVEQIYQGALSQDALVTRSGITLATDPYVLEGPLHSQLSMGGQALLMISVSLLAAGIFWVTMGRRQPVRSQDLNSINQMLVILSHQMRNPLAAAMGNIELLELTAKPSSRSHDKLRRIKQGLDEIHHIAENLFDDSTYAAASPQTHDLETLVNQILSGLECGDRMHVTSAPGEMLATFDDVTMRHAIGHIIKEAELRTCHDDDLVNIHLSSLREHVTMTVSGRGCTREEHQKMWGSQVSSVLRDEQVRLIIARNIVEAHGGTLKLPEDTYGPYQFVFVLPRPVFGAQAHIPT